MLKSFVPLLYGCDLTPLPPADTDDTVEDSAENNDDNKEVAPAESPVPEEEPDSNQEGEGGGGGCSCNFNPEQKFSNYSLFCLLVLLLLLIRVYYTNRYNDQTKNISV